MRYKFDIPTPSAKRLEKDRRLMIKVHTGCWGSKIVGEFIIPEGAKDAEFDFEGKIEHFDPNILDGDYYHSFYVLYQNSTGTRQEEIGIKDRMTEIILPSSEDHS
jgi:hypothetical protein